LVLAVSRVEELKDSVTLDVYGLDVDELVIRPLVRIRMRGSVFRNQDAVAVTDFAEQNVPDQRSWEYSPVLTMRCLR